MHSTIVCEMLLKKLSCREISLNTFFVQNGCTLCDGVGIEGVSICIN